MMGDFVDEELTESQKSLLIRHAENCVDCNTALEDLKRLKRMLARMKQVDVSPSFDAKLMQLIERENVLLSDPWYRMKLYARDNAMAFTAVPAAAAAIMAAVLLFTLSPLSDRGAMHAGSGDMTVAEQTLEQSETDMDVDGEVVHYVLDSVNKSEADVGIFLNGTDASTVMASNTNIRLISF